jgi:DnaJ-class molecular chaperone
MPMPRDYYDVLGVKRDASADDLRRAHRKLARQWHPDVNKTPEAATKFAEAQEAYDILSDADKRATYDRFGHAGLQGGAGAAAAGGDQPFGGGFGGFDPSQIDPEMFEQIFGGMGGGGRARGRSRGPSKGQDRHGEITVPFQVSILGGRHGIGGGEQAIDVQIPAGIEDGTQLRVRGQGEPGHGGGPAGDLIVTVHVAPHPDFRRDGDDILRDVHVSIFDAALGAKVDVPLLKGTVTLTIPPGTGSGKRLRVRGQGVRRSAGASGDFLAIVQIDVPETLSDDDRAALEAMRESVRSRGA